MSAQAPLPQHDSRPPHAGQSSSRQSVLPSRSSSSPLRQAFSVGAVFDRANVEVSGVGTTKYRHVSDESGRWLDLEFCPRCGTTIGFTLQLAPAVRLHDQVDPPGVDPAQARGVGGGGLAGWCHSALQR